MLLSMMSGVCLRLCLASCRLAHSAPSPSLHASNMMPRTDWAFTAIAWLKNGSGKAACSACTRERK